MIKSFIFAATSIAYILSISSIADAKVAKISKSVNRVQSCENPVDSNSQYNQLLKDDVDLKKDMKIICQLIIKKYADENAAYLENEIKTRLSNGLGEVNSKQVENMKMTYYKRLGGETTILVVIEHVNKRYLWRNNKWSTCGEENRINKLVFGKKDNKWEITREDLFDSKNNRVGI